MNRLLASFVGCAALAAGAQEVPSELASAHTVTCKFGAGTRTAWVAGQPKTSDARMDNEVIFDSIDLAQGKVRVLANMRIADAHVAMTPVGMFVLDGRPGMFDMTTIFASRDKDGSFPAVDTHQLIGPAPSSEQYFGSCKLER